MGCCLNNISSWSSLRKVILPLAVASLKSFILNPLKIS